MGRRRGRKLIFHRADDGPRRRRTAPATQPAAGKLTARLVFLIIQAEPSSNVRALCTIRWFFCFSKVAPALPGGVAALKNRGKTDCTRLGQFATDGRPQCKRTTRGVSHRECHLRAGAYPFARPSDTATDQLRTEAGPRCSGSWSESTIPAPTKETITPWGEGWADQSPHSSTCRSSRSRYSTDVGLIDAGPMTRPIMTTDRNRS